jgi:hypothetical protein
MDPILAQQDQKRQNQKRQGWDRQAWRVAEHSIILVQLHYRGVVRLSVLLRDAADAGLPDRRAAPPGTGAGAQADPRRGGQAIHVTQAGPDAWKGSEPVIVGVEVKVGRKLAGSEHSCAAKSFSAGVDQLSCRWHQVVARVKLTNQPRPSPPANLVDATGGQGT